MQTLPPDINSLKNESLKKVEQHDFFFKEKKKKGARGKFRINAWYGIKRNGSMDIEICHKRSL